MKGQDAIIELLNDVLTGELVAINQYFADAKMYDNWGYERLAKHFRDESMGEMRDAEHLMDRILYLEGLPNMHRLGPVRVGETPVEKLQLALDLEREAIARLNAGIAACTEQGDHGTRDLLEEILEGEEGHADWLETQLALHAQLGEAHYLAQQVHD
jgi:bacterioferritin